MKQRPKISTKQAMKVNKRALLKVLFGNANAECFFSGAILTFAFAPFNVLFAIPLSFTWFLLLLERYAKNYRTALKLGWWYGFGHYLTSLYWIGNALFARIDDFWWLIPFAYIGIPIFLALYLTPVALAVFLTPQRYIKPLAFAFSWLAIEYFRATYFIPFPWNMLGHALAGNIYSLQMAYYLGVYGGTMLLLTFGTIFYLRKKIFIFIGLLLPVVIFCVGYTRLNNNTVAYHDFSLRVVQPNPTSHHFGDKNKSAQLLSDLIELSRRDLPSHNKIIVWPEAAFPYLIKYRANQIGILNNIANSNGILIFGADRAEQILIGRKYFNSLLVANAKGEILAEYDKEVLVPFGEYIPFKKFLNFLDIVAYGVGEFTHGNNVTEIINVEGAPKFRGLICYEVIFPYVLKGKEKPEWFLTITNDSWYGNTSGPYQHLAMAKFTAAQYGIPMVRVTNTGISAVIDPFGRVLAKLGYKQSGVIDHKLPKAL
jgi:apolipoprotein N-acyltransferase